MSELPLCECGCGEPVVKAGNRFIYGHNQRGENNSFFGKQHTDKTRRQMSLDRKGDKHPRGMLGKRHSPETIEQYSRDRSGENHRMHGKHHSEETKLKISKTARENPVFKGGHDIVNHHVIYDHNDLTKNIMSMSRSTHMRLHQLFRKHGIIIPHINEVI